MKKKEASMCQGTELSVLQTSLTNALREVHKNSETLKRFVVFQILYACALEFLHYPN